MTPHPQPNSGRAMVDRRRLAGRLTAAAAVALISAGIPLGAQALGESSTSTTAPAVAFDVVSPQRAVAPTVDAEVDPALARLVEVLTDTYEPNERDERVLALQHVLGVTADGWYGPVTELAHAGALVEAGLLPEVAELPVVVSGPTEGEWAALRECEAGGDYSITNPSGKYRGAYQFDRSTWNSVAERNDPTLVGVDPAAASPADQDAMALALYTERGASPWPHCGRHLS